MTRNEKIEVAKGINTERLMELLVDYGMKIEWYSCQKIEESKADCLETVEVVKQELRTRLA